ncbi:hypothetical protein [Micromonospora carbonacea]|uniref:Uncharacterized protein n=1 Tax=Micromonospora carbonacea TaxID=47853 RepID=A0A1C5AAE5_9ACTN|nr:hypothetical protein [Micromonospora carbonacea]SCF42208.1 hypothetical protein GA0070563_11251 [Micromonospora carbonacea]
MAKNSSDSSRAAQVGQVIRATGDLSPSKRTVAVDQALNGNTRSK